MNRNLEVTNYINKATEEQIEILELIRNLIHETVDQVSEEMKFGLPVFKNTKDFSYLRFTQKHITFGFYNIDKIEDPDDILEGSGSVIRHLEIESIEELDIELITEWLGQVGN